MGFEFRASGLHSVCRAPRKQVSKNSERDISYKPPFILKPKKVGMSLEHAYAYILFFGGGPKFRAWCLGSKAWAFGLGAASARFRVWGG